MILHISFFDWSIACGTNANYLTLDAFIGPTGYTVNVVDVSDFCRDRLSTGDRAPPGLGGAIATSEICVALVKPLMHFLGYSAIRLEFIFSTPLCLGQTSF